MPIITWSAISRGVAAPSESSTMKTVCSIAALGEETIADAMNGQEVAWRARIRLQLLAQPHDVSIHRACVRIGFVSPHGIQNNVPGKHAVRILQEESEEIVFGRR